MRQLTLVLLVAGFVGCGDNNSGADMSVMDAALPDLVVADLFTPPDQAGIDCGGATCDIATQECCGMFNGMMLSATCVAKGSCTGSTIQCDGPEDCPGTMPPAGGCCVDINGNGGNDAGTMASGSGSSMCVSKCVGKAGQDANGGFFAHTKLCHATADCAGYMGTVVFGGNMIGAKFEGCCKSANTGSYEFCAPKMFAGQGGLTCQP